MIGRVTRGFTAIYQPNNPQATSRNKAEYNRREDSLFGPYMHKQILPRSALCLGLKLFTIVTGGAFAAARGKCSHSSFFFTRQQVEPTYREVRLLHVSFPLWLVSKLGIF